MTAAARIRAYLDALPDSTNLGAEFAYGPQFRSDDWPRDSYPLTRHDLEAVLADANAWTSQPALRHCLMPGCLAEFDAAARLEGRATRPAWSGAGWWQVRPTVATGYACPAHGPLLEQHRHRWGERPEGVPAKLFCSCGWASPDAHWGGYAVAAWQEHLYIETTKE